MNCIGYLRMRRRSGRFKPRNYVQFEKFAVGFVSVGVVISFFLSLGIGSVSASVSVWASSSTTTAYAPALIHMLVELKSGGESLFRVTALIVIKIHFIEISHCRAEPSRQMRSKWNAMEETSRLSITLENTWSGWNGLGDGIVNVYITSHHSKAQHSTVRYR